MIEALRKLTNGKKVLILGYGREGRATWQLLCRAGGCKEIAIADRNEKLYEEGVVMHTGPDYLEHLEEYDLVFKTPGIVLPQPVSSYRCQIVSQTDSGIRLLELPVQKEKAPRLLFCTTF